MYHEKSVKIPNVEGKIVRQQQKKSTYVFFEIGREYNPEKKYNIAKRRIIGKVCNDDDSRMFPNENYFNLFPKEAAALRDVRRQPKEPKEQSGVPVRSACLNAGSYIVVDRIARSYRLDALLDKWFGDDSGLVLDLASYLIVEEDNAAQYYPDYAYNHPLFTEGMRVLSDSSVSRFLAGTTKDQIIGFLNDWNKGCNRKDRIYISYDSTNKNSQIGDVDIIEYGHPKDKKGLPIFNVGLAFDGSNKVPLFYEEYPGSVNDISQLKYLVDKVADYGYTNIGFILDRGYFSKMNIQYMDAKGYQFVIMAKGAKPLVSSIIESRRGTFEEDPDCQIPEHRVFGTTVKAPLYADDGKPRYFHLYFNSQKYATERRHLEEKMAKLVTMLKASEGKVVDGGFGRQVTDYFTCYYDSEGRFLMAEARKDVFAREMKLCGYFCVITSEEMDAREALYLYKGRDANEKLFRADKSFLGSKSMRVHSDAAMSAKLFVEFIALIIRNRIYNLLKEEMYRLKVRKNYMTVPAAIKELEKIEMVLRSGNTYRLDHALTKTQKSILQSFGIRQKDVKDAVSKIAEVLATQQRFKPEQDEGNDGDDCDDID